MLRKVTKWTSEQKTLPRMPHADIITKLKGHQKPESGRLHLSER